jgi:hypothetical protein
MVTEYTQESVKRMIVNYAETRSACECRSPSFGERVSDSHAVTRDDLVCGLADLDHCAAKADLTDNERAAYDLLTRGLVDERNHNLETWAAKQLGVTQQGLNFLAWSAAEKICNELSKPLVRSA